MMRFAAFDSRLQIRVGSRLTLPSRLDRREANRRRAVEGLGEIFAAVLNGAPSGWARPTNRERDDFRMRLLNITVAGLAAALAACGAHAPPPMPPPQVGYVVLHAEPVTLTSELPGRVSALESSDVRPQINGVVRRRDFTEGSIVRVGQVLYEIEDAPYRAAVLNAQGQLAQAEANIRSTQLQADRYRQLVPVNGVSQQDADNAEAAAAQAKAAVLAARGALQAAEVNLGFTRIRAPITGRIGRSLFTPGALVQAGQADALATIQRIDQVYVDLTQSAADVLNLRSAVQAGSGAARVQLVLPNGAVYPIDGQMRFSDITVDQTTGAVIVRATFANPDGVLLPGLYVRARLTEGVLPQGLLAPQAGVTRNERGQAVAMVVGPGDVVVQRVVETGEAIDDKWLIESGLKPGDRLIVDGLLNLRPGAKVTARPAAGS
jgi:membrane fusion protein, multidrug efflux system